MAALIKIDHSFTTRAARADILRFCTRCGEPAESPPRDESPLVPGARVRGLRDGRAAQLHPRGAPGARAAFLIATAELKVNAVSVGAEEIFGPEQTVIGTRPARARDQPDGRRPASRKVVTGAAVRSREPVVMPVKGLGDAARRACWPPAISTCGPPRAALVTVEPSGFGRR